MRYRSMAMEFSIHRTLFAASAVIVLTLAGIFVISGSQSKHIKNASRAMVEKDDLVLRLQALAFSAMDNERGARGYAFDGSPAFLSQIEASEREMAGLIPFLRERIKNDSSLLIFNDSVAVLANRRIAFTKQIVETRNAEGRDEAMRLLFSGEGISLTDRVRMAIENITTRLEVQATAEKNKTTASIHGLNLALYAVLGLSLLLTIALIYRAARDSRKQQDSEQKFRALLDAAPDATIIVNEQGLIEMVNRQVENLFGYSRNEITGKAVEILIPEELRSVHTQHRRGFFREARVRPMGAGAELKAVRKDGSTFPVEISLSPIVTETGLLVSASVRDITERKKSEQKFRSLLDSAPDATVIVDEKGIIQMVNHQAETLFEYARAEMIGHPVEKLVPGDLREKHVQHRAAFSREPKVRAMGVGLELHAVKKTGARFPVEISLSPIETEEGILVSASVRDISLRKELENELKKSNQEMEAFTYSVSHDLRAPLRGIIGFTAILEEDYSSRLDDEAKRITSVIKSNAMKMGLLIDDLLSFSRMGKKELIKTQVNMSALVKEVVDEMAGDNKMSSVQWKLGMLASVNADIGTIRQVWINLISNAIKYSAKKENPCVEIGSYPENGQTVFYVKDNGVGFDDRYKHKLFKVFQRLHSAEDFEGTGVGLALSEKIISRHGGKTWAEGKEGEGATFYFSLPN